MCAALGVVVSMAAPAGAQSRLAVDAAPAGGTIDGGYYEGRSKSFVRLAVDYRLATFASAEFVVGVSSLGPGYASNTLLICRVAPGGGCVPNAPNVRYTGGSVGMRQLMLSRLQLGAAAGLGAMSGPAPGRALARDVRLDIALRVAGPVWVTAGVETIFWRSGGNVYHTVPRSIGIRIH